MKNVDTLSERLKTSQLAKRRLVECFQSRPKIDDPLVIARAAQRRAVEQARAERRAEQLAEQAERRENEKARREADEAAALAQQILEVEQQIELQAADYAVRKARRDQRYADRKLRSRGAQTSR